MDIEMAATKTYFNVLCIFLTAFALSACLRIEKIERRPIDANAVVVGISMKVKLLVGSRPILGAYFVRLGDTEDTLKQDSLIFSETLSNSYVYLLNAQPGRYAVVAVSVYHSYGR